MTTTIGRLSGFAIRFDDLSLDLGGFRERIRPQAVDRTLRDNVDVRCLCDHDTGKVIGRVSAGTLTLRKDAKGLAVDILLPDTSAGRDAHTLAKRGDVNQMSFGFTMLEDVWYVQREEVIRDVTDMIVRETSIVGFPAYPTTSIVVERAEFCETPEGLEWSDDYSRGKRFAATIALVRKLATAPQPCAGCGANSATRLQTRAGHIATLCDTCSDRGGTVEQRAGRPRSPRELAHSMVTSGCWTWAQAKDYIDAKGR